MSISDMLIQHANILRTKTGITNKLTFADMTRLLDDLSWNKQNLLVGTSDKYLVLTSKGWLTLTTAHGGTDGASGKFNKLFTTVDSLAKNYTYAATVTNPSDYPVRLVLYAYTGDYKKVTKLGPSIPAKSRDVKSYITIATIDGNDRIRADVESITGDITQQITIQIKDERLYPGTEPGIWTPNPADKVGGVTKRLLYALFMVRGCAA